MNWNYINDLIIDINNDNDNYRYCPCEFYNFSINILYNDSFIDSILYRSSILDSNEQEGIFHGVDDSLSNMYGLKDNNNNNNNNGTTNNNNNDNNNINNNGNNKQDSFEFCLCYIHELYDLNIQNNDSNNSNNKNNKKHNKKDKNDTKDNKTNNKKDANIIDHNVNTQLNTVKVAGSPVNSRGVVSVVVEFESFDGYVGSLQVRISKINEDKNNVNNANQTWKNTNKNKNNHNNVNTDKNNNNNNNNGNSNNNNNNNNYFGNDVINDEENETVSTVHDPHINSRITRRSIYVENMINSIVIDDNYIYYY